MRAIAGNGLPLKITAQWTDNDYYERRHPDTDDMDCVNVAGWLIRVNGKKFPRGHTDGDGSPDWTYRYTAGHDEEGKKVAVNRALIEGRFDVQI
jgi:hypothetical protein